MAETMLGIPMSKERKKEIAKFAKENDYTTSTSFVRAAIREKISRIESDKKNK